MLYLWNIDNKTVALIGALVEHDPAFELLARKGDELFSVLAFVTPSGYLIKLWDFTGKTKIKTVQGTTFDLGLEVAQALD
jgi:hypothetical protein